MTTQVDKDRFFNMAECYDAMASRLVPMYDAMQDEVIRLLFADGREDKTVVDLGAGSGIFLDKVLARHPGSRGLWVDYSPDFEAVARRRLSPHDGRVTFLHSSLEEPWEAKLTAAPDAICSMSVIHHLESAEKRRLYQRSAAVLKPGGWFFNIDETSTLYDDAYRNSLHEWVKHVDRAGADIPRELAGQYKAWCQKFDGWKARNLTPRTGPKLKGDDIHEPFAEQVAWLRAAGLVRTDVFMKYHLWSVLGGQKP